MTDKEVLSQEEIDALLSGVDKDAADNEPEVDVTVRKYDLAVPERVVGGRLPTLELLGEKFSRKFRLDLQAMMRYPLDVGAGGVQILNYGEYAASLYVPSSITIVKFEPLSGQGMVIMDAKLISRMVDQYFGGDGKNINVEGRDFTPTEKRVIARILELIYRDLAQAWSEVFPVTLTTLDSEINPALVNLFRDDEVMMVNTYHIELESGGGEVHISLPYASLEPYRSVLDTSVKTDDLVRDDSWGPALQTRLVDCQVPLRCAIAVKQMKLRDLLNLQAGDVINVDMPEEHLVYANDVPAFYAKLGEARGNLALEFMGSEPSQG